MQMNRTTGLALFLIGCGALILLDKIGFGLGSIMSLIFPAALMVFGYIGIKHGRKVLGWGMMIFGILLMLGKLSGLIGIIIAGALIVYGVSMLRRNKAY